MTITTHELEANWQSLSAGIARVRQAIAQQANQTQTRSDAKFGTATQEEASHRSDLTQPLLLDRLCQFFHLTPFERDVLLVCVGVELDASFAALCAEAQGNAQHTYPTFNLLLAAFPYAHWGALTPKAPLRHWRLIEVESGRTLTYSPLQIDERILHYLLGEQYLDDRFHGLIQPMQANAELVLSHQQLVERIIRRWQQPPVPIVQLYGSEVDGKAAIATAVASHTGQQLYALTAQTLPTSPGDLTTLALLWNREAILSDGLLLIDCDTIDANDRAKQQAVAQLLAGLQSPVIISSRDRDSELFSGLQAVSQRSLMRLEVHSPTSQEQRLLWRSALSVAKVELDGHLEPLVGQFNLNAPTIDAVCSEALSILSAEVDPQDSASNFRHHLWQLCRVQSRPQLDDLAQRIDSTIGWEDLVLPEAQKQILRSVAAHVRGRAYVYENWGFGQKGQRGLGISALFAGASGTGKTMAAEVLAQTLQLDLYRVDLSAVVSKYIGETEKNLRRIFDAAEAGSVILLFDEADALFGKRSEVKDSHDRYANMEVSYLLQRMEAYQGLAILTTNLKEAIDTAFLRRIRFVVKFPFPDGPQREEIWRRVFPSHTPVQGLDIGKLARLNVAGGNIRNIALNAAFLAADAGAVVRMEHLLEAAKGEYAKLERTLTDAEVRGWIEKA